MSYDSILKFLIDEYTKPILSWLLNREIHEEIEMLPTELNIEPIRADGVFFLQVGNKIIHLEFQTRPKSDPPLPLRMLDYWVRLYRLHKLYERNLELEQVIIFLRRDTSSKVFEENFQVGNTTHYYRVIRIWECDPTPLLSKPELLPLAVLAKSEQPEMLLSQVAEKVNAIENQRQKSNISACVELLAGINYSEELIKMYLHDDILKESVTYQRILNDGVTKGEKLGEKKGEKNEAIALISRLLKKRFGEDSETIKPRLNTLSVEQLELFGESLFDFNCFEDAIAWLNNLN
ncbi:Rpn family recombination-promoting nuclease/putative transposase [Geminocystis sp. CENA526]|uniref:Rpn family recombination-promoting nuclease/putative transposase n=1 Tax=Geminocystis sp. CENA526 TaxID=1355871 RepID=UPI003D6E2F78